jgi:hypothetical protein
VAVRLVCIYFLSALQSIRFLCITSGLGLVRFSDWSDSLCRFHLLVTLRVNSRCQLSLLSCERLSEMFLL